MDNTLVPFFHPTGIVIIGVSSNPSKLGYVLSRNLENSGFMGSIHFVGGKKVKLFGRPIFTNLMDVPDPVDLAVMIIPAPAIPTALEDCKQRGIHAVIVLSSGFKEAGEEGKLLENEVLERARLAGIRLIGPNCVGILNTHTPFDTTFLPPPAPKKGHVAFISQSGAICAAIIDWARGQGFGFSQLISLGNQVDVNETEMLPAVAEDENTRVITLYIESIGEGRKFIQAASRVAQNKPVIALKAGRSDSGQRAAASHTGAMAGQDNAYQAAFLKAGIFRASTSEEMFDWATALACCPLPRGRKMAVLTNAGGPGVIAADALEYYGLELAELSTDTQRSLAELLPPAAGLNNPIDMLASASPEQYAQSLHLLLDDENVDGILVILPPPPLYSAEEVASWIIPIIKTTAKPVVIALMGEDLIKHASDLFRREGIPEYRFPERAASSMAMLYRRSEYLNKEISISKDYQGINFQLAERALHGCQEGTWLSFNRVTDLLAAHGIPFVKGHLAKTEQELEDICNQIGFPIVQKIASSRLPHKSDIGGVQLNIYSSVEAIACYRKMKERLTSVGGDIKFEGVLVQPMLPPGQEVIIGAVHDQQFGHLMMFGSGGVEVEGIKDISFRLAPLTREEAVEMVFETWAGKKLKGFRLNPAMDVEKVIDILLRLSGLVTSHPQISEIEINPVMIYKDTATAVDVRVKV